MLCAQAWKPTGICWLVYQVDIFTDSGISSVQFSHSVVSNSVTAWTAARQASLSITSSRSLLKLMSIESVMPSNHLILCRPLLLPPSIFPSIRVFSNVSVLHIRWPKYWSFSFSISLSNGHSGLISFRMDWLDLLADQGTLKSLLQYHSSKTSVHQGSLKLSKCQGCSDAQSFFCALVFHWVLLQQYQVPVVIQFTFTPSKSPQLESGCVCAKSLQSCPTLCDPWTVAHQVPLSMGFSRKENWSELPFPSMGDLPDPGIKPSSLMSPALAGGFFTTSATWEAAETRLVLLYHPPPGGPDPDPCTSHSPGS